MAQQNNSILRDTISWLRLPMALMVVMVHSTFQCIVASGVNVSDITRAKLPVYYFCHHFVTQDFAIRVPYFYVIAGFLLFYNCDFSSAVYKRKMTNRLWTLVIPLVCWNIVYLLVAQLMFFVVPSVTTGLTVPITQMDWQQWLSVFWEMPWGGPSDGPLYFMCHLITLAILSPVIYMILSRLPFWVSAVVLYVSTALFCVWDAPLPSGKAIFFWCIGALMAIKGHDFVSLCLRYRKVLLALAIAITIGELFFWFTRVKGYYDEPDAIYFPRLLIVLSAVIGWTARGIQTGTLRTHDYMGLPFFIYAMHSLIVSPLRRAYYMLLPHTDFSLTVGFLIVPAATILLCWAFYRTLLWMWPAAAKILTGNRIV